MFITVREGDKMLKTCTKCGQEKNIEEYHKKTSSKDGHSPWCKNCTSEVNKKYYSRSDVKQKRKEKWQDPIYREKENKKQRLRNKNNPESKIINHARARAKKYNLEFNITYDDIKIPDVCPVLGIDIFVGNGKFHDGSPTLDRIDNSKGYIKGNVKVISWRANSIKRDATLEEIDKIINYIKRNTDE